MWKIVGQTWARLPVEELKKKFFEEEKNVVCWKCGKELTSGEAFECTKPYRLFSDSLRYILCDECAKKYVIIKLDSGLYKTVDRVRPNFFRMAEVLSEHEGIEAPKIKFLYGKEWQKALANWFGPRTTVITKLGGITRKKTEQINGVYVHATKEIFLCGSSDLDAFLHEFYHHYCNVKNKAEDWEEFSKLSKIWKNCISKQTYC